MTASEGQLEDASRSRLLSERLGPRSYRRRGKGCVCRLWHGDIFRSGRLDKQLLLQCLNLLEDADESADTLGCFRLTRLPGGRGALGGNVEGFGGVGFFLAESFSQNAM